MRYINSNIINSISLALVRVVKPSLYLTNYRYQIEQPGLLNCDFPFSRHTPPILYNRAPSGQVDIPVDFSHCAPPLSIRNGQNWKYRFPESAVKRSLPVIPADDRNSVPPPVNRTITCLNSFPDKDRGYSRLRRVSRSRITEDKFHFAHNGFLEFRRLVNCLEIPRIFTNAIKNTQRPIP